MPPHSHGPTRHKHKPLAPPVLYILVALAAGPRSTRDVAAEVRRISAETVSARTTRRLMGQMEGLEVVVKYADQPGSTASDFALTPLGTAILRDEIQRLKTLIERLDVQAVCAASPPRVRHS